MASGEEVAVLKVQRIIPTVFTWFTFFLHPISLESGDLSGQNTEANLPASKLIVAPCATSCSLGTCSIAKVIARVTDMVICVFHAPVTLPRCK